MELRGKTVLITGAGRGLGAAMAKSLAHRGANLALLDLDDAGLAQVRTAVAALGVQAETYRANVAVEADVVGAFDRVVARFGRLDGVIANAGILRDGLLVKAKDGEIVGKLSLEHWRAVIDVNLTGVFLTGREAAERMIRLGGGGCIINISSLSRAGNFGQSNYSAAKAGVAALTVVWAKELARYGIRVNAIAPGFIKTERIAQASWGHDNPQAEKAFVQSLPLRRAGRPDDIAGVVAMLCSEAGGYVSGATLDVNGGWYFGP
jgi:3-oxoacyl-[acyl-carrier protein] reductase